MDRNEIEKHAFWLEALAEYFKTMPGDQSDKRAHCLIDAARALRHLLQAQTWRPIEEAPRDGTWIWTFWPKEGSPDCYQDQWKVAKWVGNYYGDFIGFMDAAEHEEFDQPTHWMPLPQPPSSDEEPKAMRSEQQNEGEA